MPISKSYQQNDTKQKKRDTYPQIIHNANFDKMLLITLIIL